MYAYSRDSCVIEKESSLSESCTSCHSCESINKSFCGFKTFFKESEDFILIAECEESCGPMPVALIPRGSGNDTDISSLTLQLLSADYQGLGSSSTIPFADSQALLLDIMPDLHSVVNYFTLLDIQARGYVRPMCAAYISTDKLKLVNCFPQLRNLLVKASKALKYHNWILYSQDVKQTLENLNFTREANSTRKDVASLASLTVIKIQRELLDSTIEDLTDMERSLNILIEEEEQTQKNLVKKFQSAIHNDRVCPGYPICPISYSMKNNLPKLEVLKLPLRENFKTGLRTVANICTLGFPLALYHFHVMHKYFKRKYENISLNSELESSKGRCLHFGACLRNHLSRHENTSLCNSLFPIIPKDPDIDLSSQFCLIDEEFFDLVCHSCKRFQDGSLLVNSLCNVGCSINDSGYGSGCPNEFIAYMPSAARRLGCNWHGASLNQILDIVESWNGTTIETLALEVLKKIGNLHHLVYSILMGYPVLIIGTFEQQQYLKAVAMVLSCLVPRNQKDTRWIEVWSEPSSRPCDFQNIALISMPLPKDYKLEKIVPRNITNQVVVVNLKKNSVSGPTYQGLLVSALTKRLKSLPAAGPLLPLLISLLSEIEIRVQMWFLVKEKYNQSFAENYFTKRGYSQSDLDVLQSLSYFLF